MANIEIYSKSLCPYCSRAKQLLRSKNASYQEIDVASDQHQLIQMMNRSGRRTVPQIFIDSVHIGGSDDLQRANETGLLDQLLSGSGVSAP